MYDLLPEESALWQYLESAVREVLAGYGYQEIRFPIVEQTELFKRSIGEVTDIVEKEMYTFNDRNGESLTMRPEGTASCVRACLQNSLLDNQQIQRLWYHGPMFRYERPQKGRLRQFHQIGVESFGVATTDDDAEKVYMPHSSCRITSATVSKSTIVTFVVTVLRRRHPPRPSPSRRTREPHVRSDDTDRPTTTTTTDDDATRARALRARQSTSPARPG